MAIRRDRFVGSIVVALAAAILLGVTVCAKAQIAGGSTGICTDSVGNAFPFRSRDAWTYSGPSPDEIRWRQVVKTNNDALMVWNQRGPAAPLTPQAQEDRCANSF